MPASLALVLPEFPVERRSMAVGIWSAVAGFGGSVGPSAGALLIELFGWRGIFWGERPRRRRRRCPGAPLPDRVAGGYRHRATRRHRCPGERAGRGTRAAGRGAGRALGFHQRPYPSRWRASGWFCCRSLVWRSRRHPSPVLDLSLFGVRSFRVATIATLFFGCAFLGGFLLNSLLLQRLWEWPVWKTGLGLSPGPLTSVVASWLAGRAADRLGHRWLTAAGCGPVRRFLLVAVLAHRRRSGLRVGLPSRHAHAGRRCGTGDHLHHDRALGGPGYRPVRHGKRHGSHRAAALLRRWSGRGWWRSSAPAALRIWPATPRAWIWLIAAYGLSGVTMLLFYPAGSAAGRARLGAGVKSDGPRARD